MFNQQKGGGMKKCVGILFGFVLMATANVQAAPVETVSTRDAADQWIISPEVDYNFIDDLKWFSFGVNAGYYFSDAVKGYIGVAVVDMEEEGNGASVDNDKDFMGTIGVAAKLFDLNETTHIDLDAKYRFSEMDLSYSSSSLNFSVEGDYSEVQAALIVNHEEEGCGGIYAGVVYTDTELEVFSFTSDENELGGVIGVEIEGNEDVVFGLQGRFGDAEEAVTFNINMKI